MIGGLGSGELIIILFIFFLLFGAERLPKVARALGQSKGEFAEGMKEITAMPRSDNTVADLESEGRTPEAALAEEANKLGIETEGRDTEAIKEDIDAKKE